MQPDAAVMRRAGFLAHQLWVTPYEPKERYAAGDYPNQHPTGDGLPKWTAADRSLVNTDLVVWYVFGHNHVPRLEDWPVMPVASLGFMLKPDGFFEAATQLLGFAAIGHGVRRHTGRRIGARNEIYGWRPENAAPTAIRGLHLPPEHHVWRWFCVCPE